MTDRIPADLVLSNPVVAARQANNLLNHFADWRGALDLIASVVPSSDFERYLLDQQRVFALFYRQRSEDLDDTELAQLRALVDSVLDTGERLGDDLQLCRAGLYCAWALASPDPMEAQRIARRSIELADRLGAAYASTLTRAGLAYALGQAATRLDESGTIELAVTVRDELRAVIDGRRYFQAGMFSLAALGLIARSDPATAVTFAAVWERVNGMPDYRAIEARGVNLADYRHVIEVESLDVTIGEAAERVLLALDRLIAAESAGAEQGAG